MMVPGNFWPDWTTEHQDTDSAFRGGLGILKALMSRRRLVYNPGQDASVSGSDNSMKRRAVR
jgi:hypothetical protein